MLCWLNDALCRVEEARVSALDRGFLYGDTLFETMRFEAGQVRWAARHLQRIGHAAERLGFAWPRPMAELPQLLRAVIEANHEPQGVLRLTLSRGIGARGPNPTGAHSPTLLITQSPLPDDLSSRWAAGYTLAIAPWRKPTPDMLPTWAKHGNYLSSVLAHRAALEMGADDALLLTPEGLLAEASTSNVFVLSDGVLTTPDVSSGALPGITRAVVLEQAAHLGLRAVQGPIPEALWRGAQEVFLTNAVRGLMPVRAIADQRYVVPGVWTQRLAQAVATAT